MKLYIRSSVEEKEVLHYKFDIIMNFKLNVGNSEVAASRTFGFDPKILPEAVWAKPVAKYDGFVDSIRLLLNSRGFHELEQPEKSTYSNSDSEYFVFCFETDYAVCEVELCCMMRLSDHPLKNRFKNVIPEDVQEKWANKTKSGNLLQHNKKAQTQKSDYEFYKFFTEDKGKSYNIVEPNGVTITTANIVINNLKFESTAQAMTEIDMELSEIKKELIIRNNELKRKRDSYSAKPDDWED